MNGLTAAVARGHPKLIVANAAFLGLMAVFGLCQDILSYAYGAGKFEAFLFENARAVGFVEAHGLAGGIALAAAVHARVSPLFWHGFLGAVHAFLATCNLIFFDGFVETGDTGFAIAVTAVHYAIAAVHAAVIARSR